MDHGSGSMVASAEAHDSLGPSLTPKRYMQVNGQQKVKGNRTAVNETAIKRTKSRESKPTYSHSAIK